MHSIIRLECNYFKSYRQISAALKNELGKEPFNFMNA